MNERIIRVTGYGLFCLSLDVFGEFLRKRKIKTKKLNKFFDKERNLLEEALKEGIWLPVSKISSVRYLVDVSTEPKSLGSEWMEVLHLPGCNLAVGEHSDIWVGTLDMLDEWSFDEFTEKQNISYQTMDGHTLYKGYKFNVKSGNYKVAVRGYKKREITEYTDANYLFLFELHPVDQFEDFTNPLTHNVNIAKM